jgi:hypothetical protein
VTGAGWPDAVELGGVTESVVTTLGPNGLWNVAALGLQAGEPVTARTWGRTRTWRNFTERGAGVVQFTRDPRDFVDAACSIREEETPVIGSADAWVRVEVERLEDPVGRLGTPPRRERGPTNGRPDDEPRPWGRR